MDKDNTLAAAPAAAGASVTLSGAEMVIQALGAGTLTRAEALDAAITATRQFAKRQMTWFRHRMAHYIWFDPIISNLITQYRQNSA